MRIITHRTFLHGISVIIALSAIVVAFLYTNTYLFGAEQSNVGNQWVEYVGLGEVAPACVSSEITSQQCDGTAVDVTVGLNGTYTENLHGPCSSVGVRLDGGGTVTRTCSDNGHTFQNLAQNSSHTYLVTYVYDSGSGLATESTGGSFTTRNDCSPPVNGSCGSAAKTYPYNASGWSGSFCSSGSANPSSPSFPQQGETTSWQCLGSNGGSTANCSASRRSVDLEANTPDNPGEVIAGQAKTFSGTIKNVGTEGLSATFDNAFQYRQCNSSYSSCGGYTSFLSTGQSAHSLSAGGGTSPTQRSITITNPGHYQMRICADLPGSQVTERDEGHNCSPIPRNFQVLGGLNASCSVSPSTIITNGSATWSASASGGTGSYTYSWSGHSQISGKTGQSTGSVNYSSNGTYTGNVTVTSGGQTIGPIACSNQLTVENPQCSNSQDDDGDLLNNADDPGCYDSGGNFNPDDNDESDAPPPTAKIEAEPDRVRRGNDATIIWEAFMVDSCTITGTGIGGGTGSRTETPPDDFGNISGSETVEINQQETFVIKCTGPGGAGTDEDSVTVRLLPTTIET